MTPPDWLNFIPFVGLATGGGVLPRPLITRVIEQSIPGIIVAAAGVYVSDAKQTEQIIALHAIVLELRVEVKEIRRDVYRPTIERDTHVNIPK